jgi:hypothetical protein
MAGYVSVCVQLYFVGFHWLSIQTKKEQGDNKNKEGKQHRNKTQLSEKHPYNSTTNSINSKQ